MDLYPEFVNLDHSLAQVTGPLSSLLAEKNQTLKVSKHQEYIVFVDRIRLRQILWNLLSNASKYTQLGGELKVEIVPKTKDWVQVCVVDNGIGIDVENQKLIFDPFEQLHQSEWGHSGGVGLGLPLSSRLVELMGGQIWVQSEGKGKGSRFSFTLPTKENSL